MRISRRLLGMWPATIGAGLLGAMLYLLGRERKRDADAPILGGWPRVVVIGAGFGGLRTARALAGAEVEVTLLDQHNYHLFQPLLYQVATAAVEPEEIAHPVRRILKRVRNVRFRLAIVQGIDFAERTVRTDGGPVPYDYLVVASGSTTNYFNIPHLEEHALSLKDLGQAVALRNHLLEQFERVGAEADPQRRAAMLTFVVAGGGPTGVEYAGALAELIRLVLVQDYPALDTQDVRVVLVEGAPHLLPPMADGLRKSALKKLREKGVEVRLNTMVKDYDGERIVLSDGSAIASHTLVWNAGVRATDLGRAMGVELARGGRVPVQPTLQLAGHAEVFVIGDLAYLEIKGSPLPMVAPVALQQGEHVAATIRRDLAGQPRQPFRYRDRGTMATIGRNAAVAQIGRLE
ncbi:MAG TPA: NAD(P)/FAD-dependent oxidoreductase, partial [Chloroflexota bacterium]|nr:NAD(P)/FAD-dependent oxidoreductase [Chloroflexota bacterium]